MAGTIDSTARKTPESMIPRGPVISSASTLRRTTCDVCRERKVRCDRTKPECLRCRRFGSVCTYPSPDTDAAKIHETLHNLSKRLGMMILPQTRITPEKKGSIFYVPSLRLWPSCSRISSQSMLRAGFIVGSIQYSARRPFRPRKGSCQTSIPPNIQPSVSRPMRARMQISRPGTGMSLFV